MELLEVEAFSDGHRDGGAKQAVLPASPAPLVDALVRALEFEAEEELSEGGPNS